MSQIDFNNLFTSTEIKLKLQSINKKLTVNAFRVLKSKFGNSYLCYCLKYNRIYYANSQLKAYLAKIQPDLKIEDGYYYKDDELTNIVEFKIKSKDDVTSQVELEIIKQKKQTKTTDEILPLSESEKEEPVKVYRKADLIVEEITNDIVRNIFKKK